MLAMGNWDFEQFYRATYAQAWKRLRWRGARVADAEDALQATYLRLWRLRAAHVEPPGLGYVIQLAIWELDRIYRERRAREPGGAAGVEPVASESPPGASADLAAALEACLAKLLPAQRWCVLLAHYWNIPRPEAAALLDLTEAAYDAHRRRGHAALAECMRGSPRGGIP
jgi:DNA-directed RNA polymerase specialized sigma24 family protein